MYHCSAQFQDVDSGVNQWDHFNLESQQLGIKYASSFYDSLDSVSVVWCEKCNITFGSNPANRPLKIPNYVWN